MSVLTPIEEHLSLNYVDIKKDAGPGVIDKINDAGKAIFTAGPPSDPLNLATIKKVIETNYAKLFTIMSSGNSKDIKITYNINNFFIDAGWSKHDIQKYIDTDSIKICTTPAMYSDPGSRDKGDVFIPINKSFNLEPYGIAAIVTFGSTDQPVNPDTIRITIESTKNPSPYVPIECDLNFKHEIIPHKNNQLEYFKGNTVKNNYISKNTALIPDINKFVLCKELGDTMQAICLKDIIDKDTTKTYKTYTKENSALLTNDHVLAARCLTLQIPYILLSNKKIMYRSPGDAILVNTNFFLTFINNALEINKEQQKFLEEKITIGYINVKTGGTRKVTKNIKDKFEEIIGYIEKTNEILEKLSLNYKRIDFKNDDNLSKFKIFIRALTVQSIDSKAKQLFDRNLKNIHEEQVHINSNPVPLTRTTFGDIKIMFLKIFLNQTTPATPVTQATPQTITNFMKHILEEGSELYNFYIGNITTNFCWLNDKKNLGEFIIANSNIGGNKSKKRAKGLLGIRKTRVIKIIPRPKTPSRANMSLQAITPPQKTITKRKRETSSTETSSIKTSSIKPKFNLESLLDESNSVKLYQEQNYTDNEAVIYIYHKIYSFIYINPYYYDYLLENFEEFKKLVQLIITDYDLENNYKLQEIYTFVTDKNELEFLIKNQIKEMEEHIFIDKYLKKGKFEDIDNIEPIVTRQFQLQIEEILRNRNNAQLVRFEFPKKKPESEPIPRVRTRSILPRLSTSKRGRKTRRRAKSL